MMRQAARLKLWHRCCGLETRTAALGEAVEDGAFPAVGEWWWMVVNGSSLIG